ncbi:MAG: thiol-disulfide isomerase [Bryobacteraceae bacterium]|nr:thiol-disulfide isomerase [Bryobacteraceae bacterium]
MKAVWYSAASTLLATAAIAANSTGKAPTFAKDVAPIVFNRCAECHRPGEAAPMSFTNYKEVRPWAKAIKEKVVARTMPPWLADPAHGKFANDRSLSQQQIDTIVSWVNAGAPEGNAKDLPKMPEFTEGWGIGKPDLVIDMGADFDIPAEGEVPYKYFTVDPGFKEDIWVTAAEARPQQRGAVHHIIVFLQEPNPDAASRAAGGNLLVGWAPGEQAVELMPGTAKLIKAGTKLRFQMHYTPNGKALRDRSYIGLKLAKEKPQYKAVTANALTFNFKIPPNDPNYEVKSHYIAKEDIEITSFMPHMHVRGKDFKYTVTYPDGRSEVVLSVPQYDFNWQLVYVPEKPLLLPKGSRIDCVAHFDNSANNKYNPNPNQEVKWGDQTWEEMMIGWFNYRVPAVKAEMPKTGAEE